MKDKRTICEKCGHEFNSNENWNSSLCLECENEYNEIKSGKDDKNI